MALHVDQNHIIRSGGYRKRYTPLEGLAFHVVFPDEFNDFFLRAASVPTGGGGQNTYLEGDYGDHTASIARLDWTPDGRLTGRKILGLVRLALGVARFWPSDSGKSRDARRISSRNSCTRPCIQSETPQRLCSSPAIALTATKRKGKRFKETKKRKTVVEDNEMKKIERKKRGGICSK